MKNSKLKKIFKNTLLVIAIAIVFNGFALVAKANDPAPSCQLEVQSGDTLVNFGGTYLLTSGPAAITKSTNLPMGYYDIYLQSYDSYSTRISVYQPYEQYFVSFDGSSHIANSSSTPDLSDYVKTASWKGKTNSNLFLSKQTTSVSAIHSYYGQSVTGGANSVAAVCMVVRPVQICGNGIKEKDEQCDDGNNKNGDGCSATCTIEESTPYCGDGEINQSSEKCDDGNNTNGDGCSATCTIEEPDKYCGDGIINQSSEQCDDGNSTNGDGCSASCTIEEENKYCGDGIINQSSEECDDGNSKNGDGCSATCKEEDDDEDEDCDASIGNQIWFDLNKNGKIDANEKGIPNVTLKLINGNKVKKKNTDGSGEYKFKNLCEGTYTVVVDAKDLPKGCYQVYDPDGKLDNTDKVKLEDGNKHTKSDFGYICESLPTTPPTGPGAMVASAFAGIVGASTIIFKKRKNIFKRFKK